MTHRRKGSKDNIQVACRLRPTNRREDAMGKNRASFSLISSEGGTRVVGKNGDKDKEHVFNLDYAFGMNSTQGDLFESVAKPVVENLFKGYNGTIFAYGQTGSGKTFSMFGPEGSKQMAGIVPRATRAIFEKIVSNDCEDVEEFSVKVSYIEIYNEHVNDLLATEEDGGKNLQVRESPTRGVFVAGVNEESVTCEEDVFDLIEIGAEHRAVASTGMNEQSSRSHSICTISIEQHLASGLTRLSKVNFVDLAGSESVKKTKATGKVFKEARNINTSLHALGKCINALTDKNARHVPYRDSKLTRILQESLGGNTKTTLLVCVSPHHDNFEETLSTLRFAAAAKTIKTKATVNERQSPQLMEAMIRALRAELQKLKKQLRSSKAGDFDDASSSDVERGRDDKCEVATQTNGPPPHDAGVTSGEDTKISNSETTTTSTSFVPRTIVATGTTKRGGRDVGLFTRLLRTQLSIRRNERRRVAAEGKSLSLLPPAVEAYDDEDERTPVEMLVHVRQENFLLERKIRKLEDTLRQRENALASAMEDAKTSAAEVKMERRMSLLQSMRKKQCDAAMSPDSACPKVLTDANDASLVSRLREVEEARATLANQLQDLKEKLVISERKHTTYVFKMLRPILRTGTDSATRKDKLQKWKKAKDLTKRRKTGTIPTGVSATSTRRPFSTKSNRTTYAERSRSAKKSFPWKKSTSAAKVSTPYDTFRKKLSKFKSKDEAREEGKKKKKPLKRKIGVVNDDIENFEKKRANKKRPALSGPSRRVSKKTKTKNVSAVPGGRGLKTRLKSMRSPFRSTSRVATRVLKSNRKKDTVATIGPTKSELKAKKKHRTISTPMQKRMQKRKQDRTHTQNQLMMWNSDFEFAVIDIDCKLAARDVVAARAIFDELKANPHMESVNMKRKPQFWRVATSLLSAEAASRSMFETTLDQARKTLGNAAFEKLRSHFDACSGKISAPNMVTPSKPDKSATVAIDRPGSCPRVRAATIAAAFDAVADDDDDAGMHVPQEVPPTSAIARRVPVTPKSALRLPKSTGAWGSARRVRTPCVVSRRAICEAGGDDLEEEMIVALSPPSNEALGSAQRIPTGRKPPRSQRKRRELEPLTEDAIEMGSRVSFEVIKGKKKKGKKNRASFLSPVRRSARVAATTASGVKLGGGASLQHLAMMISSKHTDASKPSFESLLEEADFNYRPNAALADRNGDSDDVALSPSSASTPGKSPKNVVGSEAKETSKVAVVVAENEQKKGCSTPLRRSKRLQSRKSESTPVLLG
eukprot:g1214.t1